MKITRSQIEQIVTQILYSGIQHNLQSALSEQIKAPVVTLDPSSNDGKSFAFALGVSDTDTVNYKVIVQRKRVAKAKAKEAETEAKPVAVSGKTTKKSNSKT